MGHSMPLCVLCKRYHRFDDGYIDEKGNRHKFCDAYPDGEGIPDAVYWTGHFKPKPRDNGLQFEASDNVSEHRLQRFREQCVNEDEDYANYRKGESYFDI